jgi:hypothetical protein
MKITRNQIVSLMEQHPDLMGTTQIRRLCEKQLGGVPSNATIWRAQQTIRDKPVVTQPQPDKQLPSDSSFVPDVLLQTIGVISGATSRAGGYDVALDLAAAIEASGGVDNFRRAVHLLKEIHSQTGVDKLRGKDNI